ncbi:hypothetical protein K438DRAFT_1595897 [Mycena galopus ATCC 62051]|nr:hypothetical protein K438DRAFT_1595897 [Mycena galopus ATCC 62051]
MAVPLTHVNLNIPPALVQNGIISVAGIRTPPAAANPPTPVDVKNAVKLKAQVVRELVLGSAVPDAVIEAVANYESDIVLARQIALAPALGLAAAAAPPAPTGPMAGVALILNAITALNQTVTASNHSINLINLRLADIQREIAIVSFHLFGIQVN